MTGCPSHGAKNARVAFLRYDGGLSAHYCLLLTARQVEEVSRRRPVVPPPSGVGRPGEQDPTLSGIDAVFFLSAVEFSPDHERALVDISTWAGGECYFL